MSFIVEELGENNGLSFVYLAYHLLIIPNALVHPWNALAPSLGATMHIACVKRFGMSSCSSSSSFHSRVSIIASIFAALKICRGKSQI